MKLARDFEGNVIGLDVLYPDPKHFEQVDREIRKLLVDPLTLGERIWGPMMRMSGPPAFSELDRLVMTTRRQTANRAVEELLRGHALLTPRFVYTPDLVDPP